jgi:uncharacterized protein (DUF1499 family)
LALVLKICLLAAAIIVIYFAYLSMTAKQPAYGLVEGRLRPCPGKPNCACSEFNDNHFVEPLLKSGGSSDALDEVASILVAMGGSIGEQRSDSLWVTFRSRIFRFVDDLEVRLDAETGALHVRSESRSGRSDLGVNRKRIEILRQKFHNRFQS